MMRLFSSEPPQKVAFEAILSVNTTILNLGLPNDHVSLASDTNQSFNFPRWMSDGTNYRTAGMSVFFVLFVNFGSR
jgi:hypothetical protein